MRIVLDFWRAEQALEMRPALDERQAAQIVVALAQEIERDEGDGLLAIDALDVLRVAQVNPALKPLESHGTALRVERDDLAVDDERRRVAPNDASAETMDGNCEVLSLPRRDQTRTVARGRAGFDFDQRANAVVLRFEDERRSGERRIGERGEHRSRAAGFFAPDHKGERRRKEGSITEYSETDDPGRGGRRMPQVQICSISEYSVTDCQHLQPIGDINQQSSSARDGASSTSASRASMFLFCSKIQTGGRSKGNGRRESGESQAVAPALAGRSKCKNVHSVPKPQAGR